MASYHDKLKQLDHSYLWHPFTQMQEWMSEDPVIISRGDGHYLIDDQGRKYLDGVSSLWCNVHGHRKKELDDALKQQIDRLAHSTFLGLSHVPGIESGAKADRDRAQGTATGFLFRQRRHRGRDRREDGGAILATQRRHAACKNCHAGGVLPWRHRGLHEFGLLGDFSSLSQESAVPSDSHHAAPCVSLLPRHERSRCPGCGDQRCHGKTR